MWNSLRLWLGLILIASILPACRQPPPQIVEQIVEKPATVIVEQTVIVEKIVVVTATPAPTPTPEPVTIVWWTDLTYQTPKTHPEVGVAPGAYEKMIAGEYMRAHPNVKVEVTALDWADLATKPAAALAAGAPPDIMKDYLGRSALYARQGALVDLNTLLPPAALDDILPDLRRLYTIGGKLHAMPAYYLAQHLIYNKGLLDAAGQAGRIPPKEKSDWTFDDFAALGQAIKGKVGVEALYAASVASEQGDFAVSAFLWGAGAQLWKDDCSGLALDSPQALAGMETLNALYQAGLINKDAPTAGLQDADNLMTAGLALTSGGSLVTLGPALEAARKEGRVRSLYDPQIALYPHAAGQKSAGLPIVPSGYFIFHKAGRTPAQLNAIADFLLTINGEKWLRDGCINSGQLPALRSVGVPLAGNPNYEQVARWVQEVGVVSAGMQCPGYAAVRAALPPFFQAMFLKQMTPQQALDGMMAKSKEILATSK